LWKTAVPSSHTVSLSPSPHPGKRHFSALHPWPNKIKLHFIVWLGVFLLWTGGRQCGARVGWVANLQGSCGVCGETRLLKEQAWLFLRQNLHYVPSPLPLVLSGQSHGSTKSSVPPIKDLAPSLTSISNTKLSSPRVGRNGKKTSKCRTKMPLSEKVRMKS
jgi:hypothetical protein